MVKDAPNFKTVGQEFLHFCQGDVVLIGHNFDAFDLPMLAAEAKRHSLELPPFKTIDTLKWARKYRPDLPRHNLQVLCQTYKVEQKQAHRALDDVLSLHVLFSQMIDDLPYDVVYKLMHTSPEEISSMPFGKFRGKPLDALPKDYVLWLKGQNVFEKKENSALKLALEKKGLL